MLCWCWDSSAFLQKQDAKSPLYIIFNMYIGLLNSLPIPAKTSEQCGWGKGALGMHLQLGFALKQLGAAPQLFRSFVRKCTALSAFPLWGMSSAGGFLFCFLRGGSSCPSPRFCQLKCGLCFCNLFSALKHKAEYFSCCIQFNCYKRAYRALW